MLVVLHPYCTKLCAVFPLPVSRAGQSRQGQRRLGGGQLDVRRLSRWGYQWVIVDGRVSRTVRNRARTEIFGESALVESCGDFDIYRLKATTPEKKPVHPFSNRDVPAPKRIDGTEMY